MQPPEVGSCKSLTTDACTYVQVNFLDLEEQRLYSRKSLVVDILVMIHTTMVTVCILHVTVISDCTCRTAKLLKGFAVVYFVGCTVVLIIFATAYV